MKLWIVGKDGLLGQALVKELSERGAAFVATSRLDVDVTQMDQMRRFVDNHEPTHLINCAGYTAVDLAEKEQTRAYLLNAIAPEHMGQLGIKVVHFSTDYVFDGQAITPYTETDPTHPLNVYGLSKLEGEKRLLEQAPRSCVMRISWLFGRKPTHFVAKMVRLLQEKEVIGVAHDQVGTPTYAADVAQWTLALLDQNGIWHAANAGVVSRYDWALCLRDLMQQQGAKMRCREIQKTSATDYPLPAKRPAFSALATDKLRGFGISPEPWQEALKKHLQKELLCHVL